MMGICWQLETAIDNLETAIDRKVCAEVDAGARGMPRDFNNEAFVARDNLEKEIQRQIQQAIKMTEIRVRSVVRAEMKKKLTALI